MNWSWLAERRVLTTNFSPADCEARLRARIATWPFWRPTADHPVAGTVSPTGFSLTRAVNARNSFQTEARGTFVNLENRTRIQLTLGPSPVVLIFVLIWLALVIAFLIGGLSGDFAIGRGMGLPPVAIPIGMLLVGIAAVALGRVAARGEAKFLLRFLQDELQADEVSV